MDADASDQAGIGPLVGSLGLSPLVSRVPDFESRRALVVQADILLWPERLGEVRSIVLDGMASEMAVIAVEDPDAPALGSRGPARLVPGDPASWAEAIRSLLADAELRRSLGTGCAGYIGEHHRSASHIAGVFDAYERLCGWLAEGHEGAEARP
jgi:glycosyltransferase involved in cell wall biosynthesis